jgi:betaine-aldehyde dehydrogenase
MEIREKLYIDGRWVPSAGTGRIDVICGSTEEVMARIPEGNAADVDAAVRSARAAFEGWAATPLAGRAAFLQKIQGGLKARSEEIGRIIAREVGMPLKLATMIQAGLPVLSFGIFAEMLTGFQFEERIGHSLVVREPVGVVAAITPWNYPLHQIAAKVAPALAAGCTVVVKPSEVAPINAFILAEIIDAAGLPRGVFNLVTGYGGVVGEALAGHREVDMISFTGSTRAGKRVSELAAQSVKRVALELGGKSASILLEDADFAAAAKGTVSSCFLNSGQTCAAHTRMLVPESKYDEAVRPVLRNQQVGPPCFPHPARAGSRLYQEGNRGRGRTALRRPRSAACPPHGMVCKTHGIRPGPSGFDARPGGDLRACTVDHCLQG